MEIVLQVNGKIKAKVEIDANASKEEMAALAKENEKMQQAMEGKQIVKEIVVPGKLVNFDFR